MPVSIGGLTIDRSNITPGGKVTFYTVDFNGSGSITISMKKLVTEPGEDYDLTRFYGYDDTEVDVTNVDG